MTYYEGLSSEEKAVNGVPIALISVAYKILATDLKQYSIVCNQVLLDSINAKKVSEPFNEIQKIIKRKFNNNPKLGEERHFDFSNISNSFKSEIKKGLNSLYCF